MYLQNSQTLRIKRGEIESSWEVGVRVVKRGVNRIRVVCNSLRLCVRRIYERLGALVANESIYESVQKCQEGSLELTG